MQLNDSMMAVMFWQLKTQTTTTKTLTLTGQFTRSIALESSTGMHRGVLQVIMSCSLAKT